MLGAYGLRARSRSRQNLRISRIADRAINNKAIPDKQHSDRTERGGDDACALIQSVPAHSLTNISRDKGTRDPQCCRK